MELAEWIAARIRSGVAVHFEPYGGERGVAADVGTIRLLGSVAWHERAVPVSLLTDTPPLMSFLNSEVLPKHAEMERDLRRRHGMLRR